MKEDQQPPLHLHHQRKFSSFNRKKFTKPTAYVILLLLSYALGYLSSPSSFKPQQNSYSTPKIPQATKITENAVTDGDHFRRFMTQCAGPVPSQLVRQTILENIFNGTSPYENFPPAHVSPLLRPKRITGWGSKGSVFETLIRKVRPNTIIEIGSFLGASATHMADLASRFGLETQILCVDDFRGWPGFHNAFPDLKMINGDVLLMYQFMQNVISVNATGSILFAPFSTGAVLEMLCAWGIYGDLIEVDAGHDFHSAWTDINRAYKILRPGGVIFGHDYFNGVDNFGVRRAVDMFARVNSLRVRPNGQHWVIDSV